VYNVAPVDVIEDYRNPKPPALKWEYFAGIRVDETGPSYVMSSS
jgi:hypothetical protein